jgi:hypothetical protein
MRDKQTIALLLAAALVSGLLARGSTLAQNPPTATPAVINIPTQAPPAANSNPLMPTITPTWTATPIPAAQVEARDLANVRDQPTTEAARIGEITNGTQYTVTGVYFNWVRIEYPPSPSREGWVYRDLVNVIGDLSQVTDLANQPTNTPIPPTSAVSTNEAQQIAIGGGVATGSAPQAGGAAQIDAPSGPILPTYTYPADIPAGPPLNAFAPETTAAPTSGGARGGLPPIVPILALGAMGLLGLAASSLRRG